MSYTRAVGVLLIAALCAGCVSREATRLMSKPVDCNTAAADAAAMKAQRAGIGKMALANLFTWVPPLQLFPLIGGDFNGTFEIAIGRYNDRVDKRARQFLQTCGLWP